MEEKSLAMSLIDTLKAQCKRQFIILLVVVGCWLTTIGVFIWYINQYDYVEEYTNTTDSGGNACIGDNCNNGNSIQKDKDTYTNEEE